MAKINFKLPPEIQKKDTGEICTICNCLIYLIDGKHICGGCNLVWANDYYHKRKDSKINPELLTEYNESKYIKKEKKND